MARLLQKSNQPSNNAGSWGGLFTCCFAHPRTNTPPPVIPSIKVQGPLSNISEPSKEREVADGNSVVSQGSAESGSVLNKVAANVATGSVAPSTDEQTGKMSKPSSQHIQAMYNSWAGKNDQSEHENPPSVTLSAIAGRNVGATTPASQAASGHQTPAPADTQSTRTSVHEFAEERYTKGYNWQSQGNPSVQDSPNVPANTTVYTHIKMDYKSSDLTIQIKNVDNAPNEEYGGSQAYQIRMALIGLKKKKRWHSRIVPAPNPTINEDAVFKGIIPDDLAKMALRIRLYGCKRHRRHFIFAESTVSFTALNLRAGEADIPFALVSRVGHESVVDSDSDNEDESMGGSRFGSRLSLHSRASHRSLSRSHRSGSRNNRPPSAASMASRTAPTEKMPELETARRVAADKDANWPELLCGLAYNNTTKRLNISVLRANRLRIPDASFKSPKVYVSLTLQAANGDKVTSSHTHDVRLAANTEFGEKFAFDMNSLNPREVTLFVRVFQKHHIHKHESLGWFAIGAKNSGEEERSHWNEMLQAQGKEISRWHVLNENV